MLGIDPMQAERENVNRLQLMIYHAWRKAAYIRGEDISERTQKQKQNQQNQSSVVQWKNFAKQHNASKGN